jgi:hypothetical protein
MEGMNHSVSRKSLLWVAPLIVPFLPLGKLTLFVGTVVKFRLITHDDNERCSAQTILPSLVVPTLFLTRNKVPFVPPMKLRNLERLR